MGNTAVKSPIYALVTAGGHGLRMHADRPKQFIEVAGRPVIVHTLRTLQQHSEVDKIFIVCALEWEAFVREEVGKAGITKFSGCFPAGLTGVESIRNGIKGIFAEQSDNDRLSEPLIMVHESVRPLLSAEAVSANIRVARERGNALTCISSNEAYLIEDGEESAMTLLPREGIYRVQTPQTFRLSFLRRLFSEAAEEEISRAQSLFTFVKKQVPDYRFYLSPGEMTNFKITHPEDLSILAALLTYASHS